MRLAARAEALLARRLARARRCATNLYGLLLALRGVGAARAGGGGDRGLGDPGRAPRDARPPTAPLGYGWAALTGVAAAAGARAFRSQRGIGLFAGAAALTLAVGLAGRGDPVSVPPVTLRRVFWRCLFLQAAWNRRGMQNLGFAYAIDPALRRLYADPGAAERGPATPPRHLQLSPLHGRRHRRRRHPPRGAGGRRRGAPRRAARVQAGAAGAARRGRATASSGPASAPSSARWPRWARSLLGWPALVAALLLYNALHLWFRWTLFRAGYRAGDEVVLRLASLSLAGLGGAPARRRRGALAGVGAGHPGAPRHRTPRRSPPGR